MSQKPAVLVHPPLALFELRLAADFDILHWPTDRTDITAAVTIGQVGIPGEAIAALPGLRLIACFGVGVDGLDLGLCRARGVAVTHGRAINHEDVADVAMGLVIACARRMSEGAAVLRAGAWAAPLAVPPQRRLRGMKLGVVGMGAIGEAVAARAAPFGLAIAWTGPRAKPHVALRYEPDLLALATWADVLVVCARGDQGCIIDAGVIAALGEDGYLINIARGSLVDEDALIAALKAGKLAGAGLDVFAQEPTAPARWADVPNAVLTPHIGGGTREALFEGAQNVLENLRRHFAGEALLTPLET